MAKNIRIKTVGVNLLEFSGTCTITSEVFRVSVPFQEWKKWLNEQLSIDEAFKSMSEAGREFVRSGLTPEEQASGSYPISGMCENCRHESDELRPQRDLVAMMRAFWNRRQRLVCPACTVRSFT